MDRETESKNHKLSACLAENPVAVKIENPGFSARHAENDKSSAVGNCPISNLTNYRSLPPVSAKDLAEESTLAWLCGLGGSQDFHRPADAEGFVFDLTYQRLGTRENTAASGRLELCAQRV